MKLWGGRFEKNTTTEMDDFNSSIQFDCRLYEEDIAGSIAHSRMLGKQGILTADEADQIIGGLSAILDDIRAGKIEFEVSAEDIHMNIEQLLISRIGETGKKLHTGRSRNDQVALDIRIYVKASIIRSVRLLADLLDALLEIAREHIFTVMPGYTHMQKAQPITLGHHTMAYFQMFARDAQRFIDSYSRADIMPLGSGALAGTVYPLDRNMVAKELGFSQISLNSLDAVSDRDFCIEFASNASLCMMHLSRYCEELIIWSSNEFRFAEMDDAYSTGSSIMPQKKNPDVAELVRGKTGRVYGDLMALLTVMKSLPLAYNKDMQEDKESLFDAADTLFSCLSIFTKMLKSTTFHVNEMSRGALGGFTNATDLADYLVEKGLPFRSAHEVSGTIVLHCIKENISLLDMSLEAMKQFSSLFEQDVFDAISLDACVEKRKITGGPAPSAVLETIGLSGVNLLKIKEWLKKKNG
ncbi:MAG: argininosuccinate lyase [Christensenellales bacterium]|jgi:argininosuccinate lyase